MADLIINEVIWSFKANGEGGIPASSRNFQNV